MCIADLFKTKTITIHDANLKDFNTLAELQSWFDSRKDDINLPAPNLCDDYARESRELARQDGYYLSLCLVASGKVYQTQVFEDETTYHVGNLAIVTITEEAYYVDLPFKKLIKLCNFHIGGKY